MASNAATPTATYNCQLFDLAGAGTARGPPESGVRHLKHVSAPAALAEVHAGQYRSCGTAAVFSTAGGLGAAGGGGGAGLGGSGAAGGSTVGVARFITLVLSASSTTGGAAAGGGTA